MSEISTVIPIDAVKSIDEITCIIGLSDRDDPLDLGRRIKARIKENIGQTITCSIGHAGNRQLAKMACKAGKRSNDTYGDGNMIWWPHEWPKPLLDIPLEDVPAIGTRMLARLKEANIVSMSDFLASSPKQMRGLWGNVNGERLWYALNGYDVKASLSKRGMYGHGRVLPPSERSFDQAIAASRLLLVKAARRMRRDGYYAGRLSLWIDQIGQASLGEETTLPSVRDDQAILSALMSLWQRVKLSSSSKVIRIHVTLMDLTYASQRQTDIFLGDDRDRQRSERVTDAIDALNRRYGRTIVSLGLWKAPIGGYAGGKISFTRIPRAEDFW